MRRFSTVLALALLAACSEPAAELVPEAYSPRDARDAYRRALQDAGLAGSSLGIAWQRAGDDALAAPVRVEVPYREAGRFDAREAHAFGYRLSARRGQRIEVVLTLTAPRPAVFVDLYRVSEDGRASAHVASADADSRRLVFEPRGDADYVLRVQPELLYGGDYDLQIRADAALEFPVAGHDVTDIQSRFGAPRDAGRRSHHGVDIFAPRGTPVVATSHALVRRVREQNLGGLVVWLHDPERGLHLYYAHLDEQLAVQGTWVRPGDIIGRVGNTGNARTTPPHLHFGIYAQGEGPIDPDAFLRRVTRREATLDAAAALVGTVAEVGGPDVALRDGSGRRSDVIATLSAGETVRVWAMAGQSYRVAAADGAHGFVRASDLRLPAAVAAND